RRSPAMLRSSLVLVACLVLPAGVSAGEPVDYARDVKPILKQRCFACHGVLQQKAKLRLDSGTLIHKGGRSGPPVQPGRAARAPPPPAHPHPPTTPPPAPGRKSREQKTNPPCPGGGPPGPPPPPPTTRPRPPRATTGHSRSRSAPPCRS